MQRLVYLLVYPLLWLVSILPFRVLYVKSTFLFILIYYIFGYRKKVVKGNLALVFPEKTESEINSIAKKFFQHFCDLIFETIKTLTISEAELRKRFQVENLEILDPYFEKDRSILVSAGHYANWEWSCLLSKMMPHQAYAVYKPLDNPYFDGLVKRIRERFGGTIVSNKQIVIDLFRSSKKGIKTATYILSDQTPKQGNFKHRDTFMGIDVPVFTGTEELAKRLDFAVMYFKVKKVKRGYYSSAFVPLADNPKEYPDFEITRMFLNELEKQIRETPEHYLWSHKRWKLRNKN